MYLIYLVLSILGITTPYSVNESKHGEAHYQDQSKVMANIMENYHARSESICLSENSVNMEQCKGGVVQQQSIDGAKNIYGTGVVSVSDGKNNVVTFVPKSNVNRFNADAIKGNVYNRLNNTTGLGVNVGYYSTISNSIVMKDGTTNPLPAGMSGYQIYDHMPVLLTYLNGSHAAISRGGEYNPTDTTIMDRLKKGAVNQNNNQTAYQQASTGYSCADGSSGIMVSGQILCGGGTRDVPSSANNVPGINSENNNKFGADGSVLSGNAPTNQQLDTDPDNDSGLYDVNFGPDHTMTMGTSANGTSNNQAGQNAEAYDDGEGINTNVDAGQSVPLVGTFLNNCQNVTYPKADASASTNSNLGYSFNFDYYIDLDNCLTWVRPPVDNVANNYAVSPQDTGILSTEGWGAKDTKYLNFSWFGVDIEGYNVRNPKSSYWNTDNAECGSPSGFDLYSATNAELEVLSTQNTYDYPETDSMKKCDKAQTQSLSYDQTQANGFGGFNGKNFDYVNDLITSGIVGVFGNKGPYLGTSFNYWGMPWMCVPDNMDKQDSFLHYHVVCTPTLTVTQQQNDYTSINNWKKFIGTGNYPYGGLFSFGHKGSALLGGATFADNENLSINGNEGQNVANNYGVSASGADYMGQAFGSYYPFSVQSQSTASGPESVSQALWNKACSVINVYQTANTPNGSCNALMNGISFAFNKQFFDFEQAWLQETANMMLQNGWKTASSGFNGDNYPGSSGFPAKDSDGVWRWHMSDLTAPSFAAPSSGKKLEKSSTSINNGDYFVVNGEVPSTYDGVYNGSGAIVKDTSGVPTSVGWTNGGVNGAASQPQKTMINNGYNYTCYLGDFEGYNPATGNLKYSMNCTILSHNEDYPNSYGVICDWIGVYNVDSNGNGPTQCISFESPLTGESDGNTYYYYLKDNNLNSVPSNTFTMGSKEGIALNIGGNPVDDNRNWGDQWNNGKFLHSVFNFIDNSSAHFKDSDKPNSDYDRNGTTNNGDRISKEVINHGGGVDGFLRVTLYWHNGYDLDIYTQTPNLGNVNPWNPAGIYNLDMNGVCCTSGLTFGRDYYNPVENNVWRDKGRVADGEYTAQFNQFARRSRINSGNRLVTMAAYDVNGYAYYYSFNQNIGNGTTISCFGFDVKNLQITSTWPIGCYKSDAFGNPIE